MKINFIGTGSGVISLNRFFTSFVIDSDGYKLLVEAGDGITSVLLNRNIDINQINGLIISHLHQDHAGGFAGLITQMKLRQRKIPLKVFVQSQIKHILEMQLLHSYIFHEKLGFKFEIVGFEPDQKFSISENLFCKSKENSHLLHYEKNKSREKNRFTSSSFLFYEKGLHLFYTGDVGDSDDLLLFKDEPVTHIITETSHIKIAHLIELLKNNYCMKRIYLTHISDELEKSILGFHETFNDDLRNKIIITSDGMNLELKS